MAYPEGYTVWNKLVRDNIIPDLEAQGKKVEYSTLQTQAQLFVLLGIKLEEELEEFDKAIKENDIEQILEEGADVATVSQKLKDMLFSGGMEHVESYYKIIENLGQAERKINRYIKQSGHDNMKKMETIMQHKLAKRGGFDKGMYLISTEG